MTSERIDAYGGIIIPRETLIELAAQVNEAAIPFHVDHDLTQPMRTRNFVALVHDRSDGISELRFEVEIHPDDAIHMTERPGMSATIMMPIDGEGLETMEDPPVLISGDFAWFDDDALLSSRSALNAVGLAPDAIGVQRAFQFSLAPTPQLYIDIVYTVFLSVGANALWDAVKVLLKKRKTAIGGRSEQTTSINFKIRSGDNSVRASVSTDDQDVARDAVRGLFELAQGVLKAPPSPEGGSLPPVYRWDAENDQWAPPN